MPKIDCDRIAPVPRTAWCATCRRRKGEANAHHLRNGSAAPCVPFAVSLPERSTVRYPDIAMRWHPDEGYAAERSAHWPAGCSNFSITHSSACAAAIQSCRNGWWSTAAI
jgi:hypothetical protein